MAITLCVPPRQGELCAPVQLALPTDHSTQQLTSRHRVTGVEVADTGKVLVSIEITDPATSRPIDVRFDVLPEGAGAPTKTSHRIGAVERDGSTWVVHGTYLGPVADEN